MRSKRLLQILVVFVMMFSTMGSSQPALASANTPNVQLDPIIVNRNLSIWDATYIGFVSSGIIEKWHLEFAEPENFEVSITTAAGDLVPFISLQDANGAELASGVGSVSSSQPAGTYYIQVEPDSGSGFYFLKLKQIEIISLLPTVTTTASPTSLNVGETALVTVTLSNVPAEGYTSAEFTCTYDPTLLEASGITADSLFGADAAVAINGPQNGTFIVAIAGSNGNKATTDGAVFTFNVKGLLAGQAAVDCTARVSTGNNDLTAIDWVGTSVSVTGSVPTDTPTPFPTITNTPDGSTTPTATQTSTPDGSPAPTSTNTPEGTPATTSTPDGSPSPTSTNTPEGTPVTTTTPSETATPAPTFTSTPGASPTPLPDGTVTGMVNAVKAVTVGLYDSGGTLVTSVPAASDGSFSLSAPAGTYTLVAVSSGCLNAEASVTLVSGSPVTKAAVTLAVGDIDGNKVIDQFDAMTIGMSYNTSTPAAADLNNDGTINVLDLELLAQNYRLTGPIAWQ
jgi:hypothetical protein